MALPLDRPSPPRRRGPTLALSGVGLCLALTACGVQERVSYSPQQLRAELAAELPVEYRGDVLVPHEVTAEMAARAKKYTSGMASDHLRAETLMRAVTSESGFGVIWRRVSTTAAPQTLANGHGNCLSMTALYVGLARSLGMQAFYVDASDRVNALTREEELLVDTGHIASTVRTERGWSLIDFTGEITSYRTFRIIDDREALAHFYNNRGFETISLARSAQLEIPWDAALRDFTLAVQVKAGFARALNNRGVALSRLANFEAARAAYERAIAADDSFSAPRHNLANFHLRRGEHAQALRWYNAALRLEPRNPYLHYHLGLALYHSGDLEASIASFERAIDLKHDYIEPRNLLAQAYRHQGRSEDAERVLRAIRQDGA